MNRREFIVMGAAAALPAAGAAPPVIDCHAHAGTAQGLSAPWTTTADPEEILRRATEAGIQKTVIFPISADNFEIANREIASICRRYPDRFIGYAKHDPVKEKGRVRAMLLREIREMGLRGLKLHVHPTPEVLDTVAELRIPIIYHPGRVAQFEEIARDYPAVDFILAHLGSDLSQNWREHLAGIDMAKRHPNVYLDTGAVVLTRYIEQAVREVGPERSFSAPTNRRWTAGWSCTRSKCSSSRKSRNR